MKTIEEIFSANKNPPCDICEHLDTLRTYAALCDVVVEFGVRHGASTSAFLAAKRPLVYSYDKFQHSFECPELDAYRWTFTQQDTGEIVDIPECDLLFIDAGHAESNVRAELRHHARVRKWIIFHDQIEWGSRSDVKPEGLGINAAIYPFLAAHHEWRVAAAWNNCRGLLVLERTIGVPQVAIENPYTFTS